MKNKSIRALSAILLFFVFGVFHSFAVEIHYSEGLALYSDTIGTSNSLTFSVSPFEQALDGLIFGGGFFSHSTEKIVAPVFSAGGILYTGWQFGRGLDEAESFWQRFRFIPVIGGGFSYFTVSGAGAEVFSGGALSVSGNVLADMPLRPGIRAGVMIGYQLFFAEQLFGHIQASLAVSFSSPGLDNSERGED